MIKSRNKVSGHCAPCPQLSRVLHSAAVVLTSWAMGAIRRQTDCGWLVWPSTPLSSVIFSHFNAFPCNRSSNLYHIWFHCHQVKLTAVCKHLKWESYYLLLVLLSCFLLVYHYYYYESSFGCPSITRGSGKSENTFWTSFLLFTVLTDTLDFSASLSNDCEEVENGEVTF